MSVSDISAWQGRLARPGHAPTGRKVQRTCIRAALGVVLAGGFASGCINIQTPDKPIVIELNINIRQEVIYRLAEDAANTIDENSDIF
ncbi:MAG: YnbE family lipoprotein [Erythrobacter sp.]